jgi:hypothetical protein
MNLTDKEKAVLQDIVNSKPLKAVEKEHQIKSGVYIFLSYLKDRHSCGSTYELIAKAFREKQIV